MGLSPNQAISSSSPIEMCHFVMHYGSKACENFCKIFSYLLVMGLIRGFSPDQAIFSILYIQGSIEYFVLFPLTLGQPEENWLEQFECCITIIRVLV